jgi:hypothetical protein
MQSGDEHDVFFVPAQFPTIGAAIEAVRRPATIMIAPGIYAEELRVVGKESLVMESTSLSRRGVTLTGGGGETVLRVESSKLYLSGIEIRSNHQARAIAALDASVSLQDCILAGNRVRMRSELPFGAAMLCRRASLRLQKSALIGNTVDCGAEEGGGGALHLVDCQVEIAGCTIQANAVHASGTARGGGIWCQGSRMGMWRSRVTDNALFASDCEGGGIYFRDSPGAQLGGCVITGNGSAECRGGGIFIAGDRAGVTIHRNTVVRQNHPSDLSTE